MPIVRALRPLAGALIAVIGIAPAFAQPALTSLASVRPGLWEYRVAGEAPRAMCVSRADALLQIRHRGSACGRRVLADGPAGATVHYSCPGAGWGRTTLRVSSPTTVRISTQGIAENAPFAFDAEAHRLGDCDARTASR